ncbi:hypothetical protein AGMMS50229_11360 [Campylobacterota bacterium]|nr:hypothetical protein AGMMS50229_11360 [Campylobacterota bacterium]
MIKKLLQDQELAMMLGDHAIDIADFLLASQIPFSVLCNLSDLSFDPQLPEEISKSFKPLTLFDLSGYTFESTQIDEEEAILSFEAGFGEDFGSVITVPAEAIVQILVKETVVFVNLTALPQNRKPAPPQKEPIEGAGSVDRSVESFLSNPENRRFIRKR